MGKKDLYMRFLAILVAGCVIALAAYRFFFWSDAAQQEVVPSISQEEIKEPELPASSDDMYVVKRVIDGDTLLLDNGTTVRLIGVDTPETSHNEVPVQRFGKEATEFTRKMVEGLKVKLEFDGKRQGAYGRTLAYVYVDGTLLNAEIIRRGYGYAYTRFPHSKEKSFIQAERQARAKQYGLWNYSLTDGRIANLADRYERLNNEGKDKLDKYWDDLLKKYADPTTEEEK